MTKLFITSTGTGIGKTLVTTSLCWQLRQQGKNVTALKPVISGYDPVDLTNDTAQILLSCGIEPSVAEQERISPWRYRAALAPNMAAAREGNPVDLKALVDFSTSSPSTIHHPPSTLLIEGVGGIMAPINDQHTVLDWMAALNWPVLLTAGTYLGSISHMLSAISVLQTKNIPIRALILSESTDSPVSPAETATTLEKFLRNAFPVVHISRLDATNAIWKHAPPMSHLCR